MIRSCFQLKNYNVLPKTQVISSACLILNTIVALAETLTGSHPDSLLCDSQLT
jgi:hypothetical protein